MEDQTIEPDFTAATTALEGGNTSEDRISEMPDHILHHIFSFLDMKDVLQTSLLSQRWKDLWSSLHVLNFRKEVEIQVMAPQEDTEDQHLQETFSDFVYAVLYRRIPSDIDTFRVSCDDQMVIAHHLHKWLRIAGRYNLQVLDLKLSYSDVRNVIPSPILTSTSLTTLILDLHRVNSRPSDQRYGWFDQIVNLVSWPSLKTLHLKAVAFAGGEDISCFFRIRCPALETLVLCNCMIWKSNAFTIKAHNLKDLVMDQVVWRELAGQEKHLKIRVCAPKLVSFKTRDNGINEYSFVDILSLVNAEIETNLQSFYHRQLELFLLGVIDSEREAYVNNAEKCLKGLHIVRSLTLSIWLLEAIYQESVDVQKVLNPFLNLTALNLKLTFSSNHRRAVKYLLEKCPNLETLVLDLTTPPSYPFAEMKLTPIGEDKYWEENLPIQCLSNHLKLVEVRNVQARSYESYDYILGHSQFKDGDEYGGLVKFLRFLLKYAIMLEKIVVSPFKIMPIGEQEKYARFRENLLRSKRRSNVDISVL